MELIENWIPVLGYEGHYEVSDLGRVRSMKFGKMKILSQRVNSRGYMTINLSKDNLNKTYSTHRLAYTSFFGDTNLVIDHIIEGNRLDNRLENLQALSARENSSKYRLTTKKSSRYVGVYFLKRIGKWKSVIKINKEVIYLGAYKNELDAHNAYQNKLNSFIRQV